MKHPTNNVFGGFLTIYMVATAWATARRREGETGILDWVGFVFATWCAGLPAKRRIARASLAHVLRVVYRHRFLLSGAATGISRLVAGSPVLFGAALLPLALLIFWMIRVRFSGVYEKISTPRAAHAYPRLGS
jgi:hypothetical protein